MRKWPWLVCLAATVTVGCSPQARQRLKHFFFEVPEKSTPTADAAEEPSAEETTPGLALPDSKYTSVHAPVMQRQCRGCHDVKNQMRVDTKVMSASCKECHARHFGDDVEHGPVAEGECATCHVPHRSEHPSLLTQSMPDVCTECHDEADDLSEDAHGDNAEQCSRCHDAHFGESPYLKNKTAGNG